MLRKTTDGWISSLLNRRISTRITNFILKRNWNVTPNQMSFVSFLIGMIAFPFYLIKMPWLAAIFIQISSILDGVDGEIARARNMSSNWGAFFDTMLDRFVDIFAVLGVSIYGYLEGGLSFSLLLWSILSVSGSLMVSYLHSVGKVFGTHPALVGKLSGFASRDVRLFVIFVFSLFGMYLPALVFVSVLSYVYITVKFVELLVLNR
ncbi:CDP-alcohol phosphatidyltransferase family protein [Thermotoga neapolitana]|uniref:Di-myo-inositol-1,3'-phosphate-1'-phosphate synthase n=1 Tax=Thermotoga neapolitana (strain ATCC 49049 / DSM 4359 / NBRC 107923 / NS-E) TaxID=309803 RepID=B9K8G8_THENN|nr:CDP-alcohol phosphatidyltransferase family protein [Thermotoga neapolitana]ACM23251.1 Di-myo-inositol-1,3'-phosphate-1'-phosphate synthase [Thermotoga neapolitana DSM 4359]KFZ21751.1 Di-myo-inositol-1,3'-phosphate-1'-phosphate synthase [Thermotoga neapolitana LA10]